jgi:transcriptional regulator with XRE-family HTH domain
MLRCRREQLGLSLREAARRIGISPSYLVALEQGRNPTTGRAPMPSPPILAALGQVLGIELAPLLDLAGVRSSRSAHLLLYQTGTAARSPAVAARRVFAGQVDAWIEIVDPRASNDVAPDRVLEALADILADPTRRPTPTRLGLIFGANSSAVRSMPNPAALLESEATWEHDVAALCLAALGVEPAANVCVYRDAEIRELGDRLDPLATALGLVQTHPRVAVEDRHGSVATGPIAIEAILGAARPAGVRAGTWASLATAAALGMARDPSPPQRRAPAHPR